MLTGQHVLRGLVTIFLKTAPLVRLQIYFLLLALTVLDCHFYTHILPKVGAKALFKAGRAKSPGAEAS